MAADVVVTLVSVIPLVLGASLDVCAVALTAAVTLELTVVETLPEATVAAVDMVIENIKRKNINYIKDLKMRCTLTTDISTGMKGVIQLRGGIYLGRVVQSRVNITQG